MGNAGNIFTGAGSNISFVLCWEKELFLLLNNDLGNFFDLFFEYFTYAGDGLLWIIWLAYILLSKQKKYLPLILAAFIISTLLT